MISDQPIRLGSLRQTASADTLHQIEHQFRLSATITAVLLLATLSALFANLV